MDMGMEEGRDNYNSRNSAKLKNGLTLYTVILDTLRVTGTNEDT